ncbi:hypothetical protein AB0M20_31230 [Actinoplanes sp. NPDC051633]|uniref:hypothetical protein n=1 Tax=Actinoplanes sp. NPDC051633 TaxID=3155670 RepID=UPI00342BF828
MLSSVGTAAHPGPKFIIAVDMLGAALLVIGAAASPPPPEPELSLPQAEIETVKKAAAARAEIFVRRIAFPLFVMMCHY